MGPLIQRQGCWFAQENEDSVLQWFHVLTVLLFRRHFLAEEPHRRGATILSPLTVPTGYTVSCRALDTPAAQVVLITQQTDGGTSYSNEGAGRCGVRTY
jgi:hypothetical protein